MSHKVCLDDGEVLYLLINFLHKVLQPVPVIGGDSSLAESINVNGVSLQVDDLHDFSNSVESLKAVDGVVVHLKPLSNYLCAALINLVIDLLVEIVDGRP